MASDDLIKSVSRKLKYYFQIKRLEDSFDLSGPSVPVLDHPPRICGPVVHYPAVYDRSLKHYFSHPEARVQLTQFKSPLENGESLERMGKLLTKEERIRKVVERYLRTYDYAPQPVPFQAFIQTKNGLRLRPELRGVRGPYRTPGRRARGFHGAYPVLRMTPNSDVSRQEGGRLVNTATRLLLATQSMDLSSQNYDSTASGSKLQYLPNSAKAQAAERRRRIRSGRGASGSSSTTRDKTPKSSDRGHMPAWLRREIARLADEDASRGVSSQDQSPYVRTYSAPTPPKGERRSSSSSTTRRRSLRRRTVGDGSENIATQTERRATEAEDQTYQLLTDQVSENVEYQVLVTTGTHIGASTNADVYLTLYGSLGRTDEIKLTQSKTHRLMFRKGQTDEFALTLPYVGSLKRVQIGHNSQEPGSDWYLNSVVVVDPRTSQRHLFKCTRWLSAREADGLTKRVLFPTDPSEEAPAAAAKSEAEDEASVSRTDSVASSRGATEEDASRSSRTRSRTDSGSSAEATASSTAVVRTDDSEEESDESSSSSSYSDGEKEVAVEEEEEEESDAARPESEEEEEAKTSQLDPIEEEEAEEKGSRMVSSGRPSSAGSSGGSQSSEEHGAVSPDEEDEETGRVEVEDETADFDFGSKKTSSGRTIHQAVEDGDLSQVIDHIGKNNRSISSPDERGFMPLHIACERGHLDILKWLIANGASVDTETPTGYKALHLATLEGHLESMMALNALGASLNGTTTDGQTALHIAAKNAHIDAVRWLVSSGADVELEDFRGMKPVAWATQYGHMEVVQYLRSVSKEPMPTEINAAKDNDNEDPDVGETPPPVRVVPKRLSRRLTEESLLEEKKKNYQRQVETMSSSSSSFLDTIRNEASGDN